jgi:HK97 family phage major capsid protein
MRNSTEVMAAMQAIVDLAEAETRSMSDEEVTTYEALETELKRANKTSELFARQIAYKTPIVGFPAVIRATPKGDAALDFAFEQYLRTGQQNADLAANFAQTVGTPGAGGYLVPDGFRVKMTERLLAFGGLRGEAETIDTGSGNPIEWPTFDGTAVSGAGVVAEGVVGATGADLVFGTMTLGAYRYAATGPGQLPIKVSVELLQDSAFDIVGFVERALANRIARKQAADLMQGTGSGQPQGLMNPTGAGDVAESTLTYEKLNELVHKLDPAYRPTAKWIFNDTVALEVESLLDTNKRPILVPSTNGISGSPAASSLLGYPVVIDQNAPNDATNGRYIVFGDLNASYIVRNVKDVQVLVNPYAATGYVVYDAWARMDGKIQNAWSYVTINGE